MPVRRAEARWEGNLREGRGSVRLGSGAYEGPYSFGSRFEQDKGTNPEELIGAAHAGCFSMALAAGLVRAGYSPASIHSSASVHLEKVDDAFTITRVELKTEAVVPGISEDDFQEQAASAKRNCPVSRALAGVEIELSANLKAA